MFKWWMFHCYVSIRGCRYDVGINIFINVDKYVVQLSLEVFGKESLGWNSCKYWQCVNLKYHQ